MHLWCKCLLQSIYEFSGMSGCFPFCLPVLIGDKFWSFAKTRGFLVRKWLNQRWLIKYTDRGSVTKEKTFRFRESKDDVDCWLLLPVRSITVLALLELIFSIIQQLVTSPYNPTFHPPPHNVYHSSTLRIRVNDCRYIVGPLVQRSTHRNA